MSIRRLSVVLCGTSSPVFCSCFTSFLRSSCDLALFLFKAYHHRVLDAQLPNLSALQRTAYLLETRTFHPRTDHTSRTPFLSATRTFRQSRPEFLIHVISLLNKSLKT
ncbi:hypothetical protein ILYODFUR_028236 [Ilyodon furcidens]|uniref:Secreted protein n=1 Tax=Ilyodon furcidens TaxID=33524 RepID=A0ABV0T153_9TELE